MSNFTNYVAERLPGIDQYEDIFNTLAQARKLMMPPNTTNSVAAYSVAGSLIAGGWNSPHTNKNEMISELANLTVIDLREYLDEEDPSPITENRIRELIADLNNYINNNAAAEAAGRRKRKSKKSRKLRKSRKSKKSKKSRKSRK